MNQLSKTATSFLKLTYQYTDPADQHQAKGLRSMIRGTAIGTLIGLIYVFSDPPGRELATFLGVRMGIAQITYSFIFLLGFIGFFVEMYLLNRGKLKQAALAYVVIMFGIAVLGYSTSALTSLFLITFSLPITAAGVLLSRRAMAIVTACAVVFIIVMVQLDSAGKIDSFNIGTPTLDDVLIFAPIILIVDTIILAIFAGGQRLLLEQNLALTQELRTATAMAREANRLKSEFLSMMSHELRTPLNATLGFTDLLLTQKPGALNETQNTFLTRAADNNRRLKKLIDDILDLSRIEAGRMEVQLAPYSLQEMFERMAAQTSSLFSQKNLAFRTFLDPALPKTVLGDRDRLEQVVLNLLSNAVKFTAVGEVELAAKALDDTSWTISVKDTGSGVAPHMHELIFEPFRQADGTTSRQFGGTGLGLAIAQELCRMMDGMISLQSELGKGSTFTVKLPLYRAGTAPLPAMMQKTA